MHLPRTYRARLITYIGVLTTFLVGILVLTYGSSRELVLDEAHNRLVGLAQQLEGQIHADGADLVERAHMVRDNANFQEYLFIAISLNTDPAALREQYARQFGWLQIDRSVVLSPTGRAIIGPQHRDLAKAVAKRGRSLTSRDSLFYLDGSGGLEMVVTAPVSYRTQPLGVVAVTKRLGPEWMASVRRATGGELLLVKDGNIVASTLNLEAAERVFAAGAEMQSLGRNVYLVQPVNLGAAAGDSNLYFALSQAELTGRLIKQRDLMLVIAIFGALGILLVGSMMLSNFSEPIARLTAMFQEVGEGRFPSFSRVPERDEVGYLSNRFAEMVQSLREKQDELQIVHQQLEKQATTDALTGLYNRRYLYDIFPRLWSEAQRQENRLSVILIDLDLFKQINDRHGHLIGDKVLVMLAGVLRETCRVSDFAFRMGGEEFLVLTQGDVDGAAVLAEKIRAVLERNTLAGDEYTIRVTASFGVARAEEQDGTKALNQLLARADKALYTAKQAGRNQVAVWPMPRLVMSNRN
jgi:diguanylate cyclase (GGDEF)-like protein